MSAFPNATIQQLIQAGLLFGGSTNVELVSGIVAGSVQDIVVEVGADDILFVLEANSPVISRISLFKNAVYSGVGSELVLKNFNDSSVKTIDANVYLDPGAGTWGGDFWFSDTTASNENLQITPFSRDFGVVLTANSEYIFSVTNLGSSAAKTQITFYTRGL